MLGPRFLHGTLEAGAEGPRSSLASPSLARRGGPALLGVAWLVGCQNPGSEPLPSDDGDLIVRSGVADEAPAGAGSPATADAPESAGAGSGANAGVPASSGTTTARAPVPGDQRSCTKSNPDATCCDRDYGIDPQAVAEACGFDRYLGESRTLTSCQLHFAPTGEFGAGDTPAALTLAEFPGLSFQAAVDLHMSGFMGAKTGTQIPDPGAKGSVFYSGDGNLAWAHVDGWSAPRRVAWSQAECSRAAMGPVLDAMSRAQETAPAAWAKHSAPANPRPLPTGSFEGADESVLAKYVERELIPPTPDFVLPDKSMRLGVMLLERAAKDSVQDFERIFAADARWGLPDRRQLRGRPVLEDGGWAFLEGFRTVTARLGKDSRLSCPALSQPGSEMVADGKAPMWCTWVSADGLDLVVLRMAMIEGSARVDYVGFFPDRPTEPMRADGEPPPPPLRPIDPIRAERRAQAEAGTTAGPARPARPKPKLPGRASSKPKLPDSP